jgi:hypothetical protein
MSGRLAVGDRGKVFLSLPLVMTQWLIETGSIYSPR